MKKLLMIIAALFLIGCATEKKPEGPTSVTIDVNKAPASDTIGPSGDEMQK